ncbi:MAG: hypothetical protein EZS28_051119, partial [Streblomastix strix]
MTSNAKEIKAIYYGLLRFEQVFKKMQDQAVLKRSDNTTAVYDIGKWKAKEFLTERIKQVFYLVKRLKLQITTIHIPGNLNATTDSLSRLCRSGDYSLKDEMIQAVCKTCGSQRPGDTLPQRVQLQMEQSQIIYPPTNTSIKQGTIENEIGQSTGNSNSTDLAGTIVRCLVLLDTETLLLSGKKTQTTNHNNTYPGQCWRLPSGPVADVGRDLLMRCMQMRGFSEDGVNLLFKGQRF